LPRITPIDPYKLVKILGKAGFKPVRRKGSHVILIDDRRVRIVVPIHPGRPVKPGLVRAIIREAGLTRKRYFELLEKDC